MFCTLPVNVIFMSCFKINDAGFFYFCVLNTVSWLILVTCVNYSNDRVNKRCTLCYSHPIFVKPGSFDLCFPVAIPIK